MKKRIYIAYTGGTIGMKKGEKGYEPAPGFLEEQLSKLPQMRDPTLPDYVICEHSPLLDSSNISAEHWLKIALDISDNYHDYDGFIVLHGTDTMAYSASALSFMLKGLCKPVIFTGSQLPLVELRSDAPSNIINSLLLASNPSLSQVCLCFGNRILRGCRSTKIHANGFNAFSSPNFPDIGKIGSTIEINKNLQLPCRESPSLSLLNFQPPKQPVVGALRLFPGLSSTFIHNILQEPLQGLVLETFGAGNAPETNASFLRVIQEACDRGVLIVNITQCLKGMVHPHLYASGNALAHAGVISGCDMTAEAALTKLFFLLSEIKNLQEQKKLMQTNLRGELTSAP